MKNLHWVTMLSIWEVTSGVPGEICRLLG